jgi:hypothetical protein
MKTSPAEQNYSMLSVHHMMWHHRKMLVPVTQLAPKNTRSEAAANGEKELKVNN